MIRLYKIYLLAALVALMGICTSCRSASSPTPAPPSPTPEPFRVIGYATDGIIAELIPYDKLTHINYAFLIPLSDGTFSTLSNSWKLSKIVELAHEHGTRVLISVGGWGWDAEFETLAAQPETRAVFVEELVKFVEEYQVDGVDIDWEFPDAGQSAQNFLALMQQLRAALPDRLLTSAVVALGAIGEGIPSESFTVMDFVNIMAYDGPGANHSSQEYAQEALDYWLGRGLPPEKAVLGVPFYAHPNGTPYWKLVKADPGAAHQDFYNYFGLDLNYNGIPTIQAKTILARERASGVMIWALDHDSQDETSLLSAIDEIVHQK